MYPGFIIAPTYYNLGANAAQKMYYISAILHQ